MTIYGVTNLIVWGLCVVFGFLILKDFIKTEKAARKERDQNE